MKKVILGSLLLSAMLFACNKSVVQSSSSTTIGDTSKDKSITAKDSGPPGKLRFDREVQGNQVKCYNPGWNCGDNKPVVKSESYIFNDIANASSGEYPTYFAQYETELASYFTTDLINGVIAGTFNLELNGSFSEGSTLFFSFFEGSQCISCYPVHK